jgi:TolB protein
MNGDGSGATNLSNNPFLDDEPDLSPDGSKVVFLSQREGGSYLYTVNSDGSDLTRLTDDPGGDGSPRWSPDGSRIAFSRGGALAVMDADGSRLKTIMEAQSSEVAEPCRGSAVVGGWSPDGARITYYTAILATRERLGTWYICAINVDGSDVEVLVSEPAGSVQAEPTWSPDGRQIAFRSDRDSKNCQPPDYSDCTFEIYVKDLESGQETNVTRHSAIDIEPNWSPDGEWIIFVSNRDDTNFDLYATRLDGSDVRRLLADPGAKDSYPGWVR